MVKGVNENTSENVTETFRLLIWLSLDTHVAAVFISSEQQGFSVADVLNKVSWLFLYELIELNDFFGGSLESP